MLHLAMPFGSDSDFLVFFFFLPKILILSGFSGVDFVGDDGSSSLTTTSSGSSSLILISSLIFAGADLRP
jgi:hypothetical protein